MNKIFEYNDYQKSQKIKTDVCVVGSGCGGATVAKKLLEKGLDVILIEKGGYYPPSTFDERELNMAGKISGDRNLRSNHNASINLMYGDNIGGASVHYWADSYRTPQDRLKEWESKYGLRNHSYNDLKIAWEELDKRLNVHPATEDFFNPINKAIQKASKKLKWKAHAVPQARKNCQKSGHCMQGCLFNAKQSQLITHISDILNLKGKIYSDLEATEILIRNRKIEKLIAVPIHRPSRKKMNFHFEIYARAYVLALGGFFTSAFLIKNGFKKQLPALGEFFGMNPSVMVHAIFPQPMIQWRNIPSAWGIEEFRLARWENENYKEGGYLIMANQLHPGTFSAVLPGYGKEHQNYMEKFPYLAGTIGWLDDYPQELGRINVKGERIIHEYSIGPITEKMIRDLIKKQVILLFTAGAEEVLVPSLKGLKLFSINEIYKIDQMNVKEGNFFMVAPHPFGGCRMGENPTISVVNFEHQVHGIQNLFITDPSVFPTGPSVDPSYTIMAFSYIAAHYIENFIKKKS